MAISSACFARLRYAPRAQEALYPLAARLPPVSQFFVDPALREDADLLARLAAAGQRQHRHLSRPQRARQPRRLLALRAGILHARPRLAAGDGAAWRQRQRPRLSVELAARCPQPWRHPGRADRDRHHLGADGRRHRHAEPRAHSRCGAVALEHRSDADAADRHERRRHVLLRHAGSRAPRPSPISRRCRRPSIR